jgi:hypothetical protein
MWIYRCFSKRLKIGRKRRTVSALRNHYTGVRFLKRLSINYFVVRFSNVIFSLNRYLVNWDLILIHAVKLFSVIIFVKANVRQIVSSFLFIFITSFHKAKLIFDFTISNTLRFLVSLLFLERIDWNYSIRISIYELLTL